MVLCKGSGCFYGYQTIINPDMTLITSTFRSFLEVCSFAAFTFSVVLNSTALLTFLSIIRSLDNLDVFFISHIFGELLSSFTLSFLLFYQFVDSSPTQLNDVGCKVVLWLDTTSVAISITSLVCITLAMHQKLFYGHKRTLSPWKVVVMLMTSWLVAGMPGISYGLTSTMTSRRDGPLHCTTGNWSSPKELSYMCTLLVFEIVIPLGIIIFLLARMRAVVYKADCEEEYAVATEESTVFSKAHYERSVVKRKIVLVAVLVISFYLVHVTSALLSFALEMNVDNLRNDWRKYAKLRGVSSLVLSLKCIVAPLVYMFLYEKLRNQLYQVFCRGGSRYTTLRYRVHNSNENLPAQVQTGDCEGGDVNDDGEEVAQ